MADVADVLVMYYSRSGNTKKMADMVAQGIMEEDVSCVVSPVAEVELRDLLKYKAIVVGSPTYYGMPAAEIVKFFDESVAFHGRLEGKIGAAFSTSGNIGGGNETTCMAILQMMLVHGMLVVGSSRGDHYGSVSVSEPDAKDEKRCLYQGQLIAKTVKRMAVEIDE